MLAVYTQEMPVSQPNWHHHHIWRILDPGGRPNYLQGKRSQDAELVRLLSETCNE
jgi:hypothetical protein